MRARVWAAVAVMVLVAAVFQGCDWFPAPFVSVEKAEHKMHYPQLPEAEDGFSVIATLNVAAEPYYVADDWRCSESGLVTDIHFWGHWNNGSSTITEFEIAIAERIDDCDMGQILWQQSFPISEVTVSNLIPATPQGWYNPPGDYNDNVGEGYWQYDIEDIEEPFCQEEGEEYWLIIGAYVDDPFQGGWGWRNTDSDHFGCNAMYSHSLDQGWQPMDEPPNYTEPLDMAFLITGGEPCEPCQCDEEWDSVEVSWTDASGNAQSWTGGCGDTHPGIFNLSGPITVTSGIGCSQGCSPDYSWEVTTYPGMTLPSPSSGSGLPAEFTPQGSGWNSYKVTLNASCDGVECPLCTLYMRVHVPEVTPSINVDKSVSADGGASWHDEVQQNVCQNVQFLITVTNDGDVPLTNIVITDNLPDCLEYVDGPAVAGICHTQPPYLPYYNLPGTNTPTWECSELAPGNAVQVIYTAHVVESGICKNQVSVEGEYDEEIVTAVDSATVSGTIVVLPVCDRKITKTVTPNPVASGGTVTITLTVKNVGTAACPAVPGIVVADPLPAGLTNPSNVVVNVVNNPAPPAGPWTCGFSGGVVWCMNPTAWQPGYEVKFTYTATVTAPPGSIQNCAEVTNVGDANQANNQSCVTIAIP